MKAIFYLIALCCFNFVIIFFFLQKMSSDIQNYDYSFLSDIYDVVSGIHDRYLLPWEILIDIETLEDASEGQMCNIRWGLKNSNEPLEFYTPIDSADFLADRIYVVYNECPDPSQYPWLERLKNIVCERDRVRAEHQDIPYLSGFSNYHRRHN